MSLKDGMNLKTTELHEKIQQALKISAPVFWNTAVKSCHAHPEMYNNCEIYHRTWQYFVLWQVTKSMRTESDYFVRTFIEFAKTGRYRKVFISATADYNMLAHIIHAYKLAEMKVEVTVSDICETPLAVNRWYAEHVGAEIDTIQGNITTLEIDKTYNLICSHSLFLWLSLEQQEQTVRSWFKLLKPGGIVLTSTRLYEGGTGNHLDLDKDEAIDFRKRVYEAVNKFPDKNGLSSEFVARLGYEYMTGDNRKRYIVSEADFYKKIFEKAGFIIDKLELDDDSNKGIRPTGPRKGSLGRLHIQARRP